jgi:hypothetical protein
MLGHVCNSQKMKRYKEQAFVNIIVIFPQTHSQLTATTSVVYCSEFLATDPEVRVRFSALPYFLRSSGSGTGSTQPREYN